MNIFESALPVAPNIRPFWFGHPTLVRIEKLFAAEVQDGWSWTEGGCFSFAMAFYEVFGGEHYTIAVVFGDGKKLIPDHAVIKLNGMFYDYAGVVDFEQYQKTALARDKTMTSCELVPFAKCQWFDDLVTDSMYSRLVKVLKGK